MKSHELIGFMPASMASEIMEFTYAEDREVYRAILAGVAQAQKVRPVFLERKPRSERHPVMLNVLTRASMDAVAGNLLRSFFLKKHKGMLEDFLNALGIAHKEGVVEDVPERMEDDRVRAAVDTLLQKHPHPAVAVYLHLFNDMNTPRWENLDRILESDPRLQF